MAMLKFFYNYSVGLMPTLWILILLVCSLLMACAPPPPRDRLNICKIYSQYPKWYWVGLKTYEKWQVPPSVQMAVIYQESRFNAYAKPMRERLLWIIPWKRPTTASGYTQATDGTWQNYQQNTGNLSAERTNFTDASDFIGWYATRAHRRLGIYRFNAYSLYLAYHEGIDGYIHGSYYKKSWLIEVAKKVDRNARNYQMQLQKCSNQLPKKHWWTLW